MTGQSDPVSFRCTCAAQDVGGSILLFYRYFAAPPKLSSLQEIDVQELHDFHKELCERLGLRGKIRVAQEGYNVTVGGLREDVKSYMQECLQHWTFADLNLDTKTKQDKFFKPSTDGCACAFDTLSVKIASEITPLGITNYTPKDWDIIESLSPADFHERCWEDGRKVLVDVRNHYESRIGYFVEPVSGEKAITPEVRRFSQFPMFVKNQLAELEELRTPTSILTYCTGGIRCEKSVRWMAERMQDAAGEGYRICTLKGGIAAYLTWVDGEVRAGRMKAEDSLFKGRNYVFDGRGSTGLKESGDAMPVSRCHCCGEACDRLSKCRSGRCHLVLVVCEGCEMAGDPRCCVSCKALEDETVAQTRRPICACELEREARLRGS